MEAIESVFGEIKSLIGRVPEDKLLTVWPRVCPMVEKMISRHPGRTAEAILGDLLSGAADLWVIGDFKAISITRINYKPREKALFIEWLGGEDIDEWVADWLKVAEEYAKAINCDCVEFFGRRGYRRYEKQFNYKPVSTIYRKELST